MGSCPDTDIDPSTLENVWKTVWRICIMIVGCKGLRQTLYSERNGGLMVSAVESRS